MEQIDEHAIIMSSFCKPLMFTARASYAFDLCLVYPKYGSSMSLTYTKQTYESAEVQTEYTLL